MLHLVLNRLMNCRERQQSQLIQVSGLQKLTQKINFGLCLHLEMVDVRTRSGLICIKNIRELCLCAIIDKLCIEYYPVTLGLLVRVQVKCLRHNHSCVYQPNSAYMYIRQTLCTF